MALVMAADRRLDLGGTPPPHGPPGRRVIAGNLSHPASILLVYKPKITIFALDGDTGNTGDRVPATNATRCLPSI